MPDVDVASLYGALLTLATVLVVFVLLVQGVACYILVDALNALPAEHRKQLPRNVWLLMVPLLSQGYCFLVYPRIADSFKSYFDSIGRTDMGDCGRGLARAACFSWAACLIPCVELVAVACASALTLLFVMRVRRLKDALVVEAVALKPLS